MIKQAYFIFKNIASEDYLMVNKLPPITKATKDIEKLEVEARDGFLTKDKGTYRSTIKLVECTIMDLENLDFICSWLDGSGEVIFSNEPDRVYKATIINQIPFEKIAATFHKLLIQFECQPHKYFVNNDIITFESAGTVFNNGNVNSKPAIKIYGTGSITLYINGLSIALTNVNEYVVLDSTVEDAFKDSIYKNHDMSGEFPVFKTGNNTISWVGTVAKLEIQANTRWI